jgi:hypothetical protein
MADINPINLIAARFEGFYTDASRNLIAKSNLIIGATGHCSIGDKAILKISELAVTEFTLAPSCNPKLTVIFVHLHCCPNPSVRTLKSSSVILRVACTNHAQDLFLSLSLKASNRLLKAASIITGFSR